eukprot:NODE_233_length_1837_cov_101.212281_g208_i0.p1 GENE.NODE_233_length_1837_cov_101.212281_g208_i0~~NODE_233_length_1837_cov_101.212281_g208_i0.p1  ORF type:complete len:344 (+),score=5.61 NODE_233_length_1837_cov_101.212281_g208_i0:736-1767(+)
MATGMSITLVLLALRHQRPAAKYVLWPRIDQKSCFKAILTAGFTPVVVPNNLEGDELRTNLQFMEDFIAEHGEDSILCVYTTTSCFAPRVPDRLVEVAGLCQQRGVPHIINNAYGLQSNICCNLMNSAHKNGRIDAFIQSSDKNFLVPVGGSIVCSPSKDFINTVSKNYPGRASGSPAVDLFITLLSMGQSGYKALLKERRENFQTLKTELKQVAEQFGCRVLETPHNDISLAMSLSGIEEKYKVDSEALTFLGSMLYTRCVSGARVVPVRTVKVVNGFEFEGFMAHHAKYPAGYLTVAAAVGLTKSEISTFITRLKMVLEKFVERLDQENAIQVVKTSETSN